MDATRTNAFLTPQHRYYRLSQVTLHAVQSGPHQGPLVILLHGFPEFWYGWKRQIPALAGRGFLVCAPDQRGYNLSDKPAAVKAYNLDHLARDVVELIHLYERQSAVVIGHDWGAAVGWWTAIHFPDVVQKLIVLNTPHPGIMARFLTRNPEQMLRSAYIAFFQLPWISEQLLRANNWQQLRNLMCLSSRPDTFSTADLQRYEHAWSQPGALRAMLSWYRALLRAPAGTLSERRVRVPARIIWGAKDVAFNPRVAPLSLDLCDNGDLHVFGKATHWVQHEEAERVNQLILDFIEGR